MSEIRIRPLALTDLNAIDPWIAAVPTFQEYGMTGAKIRLLLEAALSDSEQLLLAADRIENEKAQISGFAWVLKKGAFGRSAYLRLIVSNSESPSRGIGTALMVSLESEFSAKKDRPGNGLFLLCTHSNLRAQAFYEGLGYQQIGTVPDYLRPGLHELIYFKA